MKVIILAGGLPSTLIEEDEKMPKPMAEIGRRPLLWHIMKQYDHFGYRDFVICTGYKGEVIKNYFMNFYIYQSDITVDLATNEIEIHRKQTEDWNVSIVDTGRDSGVIDRICMAREYVGDEGALVSYGDCLSDIPIDKLVEYHNHSGAAATFAVAHPVGRNETLSIDASGRYHRADELGQGGAPLGSEAARRGSVELEEAEHGAIGLEGTGHEKENDAWVNACNMVLTPEAFACLQRSREHGLMSSLMDCLAREIPVQTYKHGGFWSPVETVRDKTWLEWMWAKGEAPWKVWED